MKYLLALFVAQSIVLSGAMKCDSDNPTAAITSPTTGAVGGVSVAVDVTATDGTAIASVTVYWEYCTSATVCTEVKNALTPDTTPPYSVTWTFPSCGSYPNDRFRIWARSKDTCGNESAYAAVDVRLTGRGC